VGWGVCAAAFALFCTLAVMVSIPDSAVWEFDWETAYTMKKHAGEHLGLLWFARIITHAGDVPAMTGLAIVGTLLLWGTGRTRLVLCWLLAASLGGALNLTTKTVIGRPRPVAFGLHDEYVTERNESYPSGHAMGSTIGYGSLAYVSIVLLRRRWAKVATVTGLTMLVLAIGWSRIYLRAHWCSDVIGGYAIGIGWLALCITVAESPRWRET
jgi:undecaprenyl-diphosphatase